MAWETSDRRRRLPPDWAKRRVRVLERDGHRCTWVDLVEGRRVRCSRPATDVDHHIPGDDHSLDNLRSLCGEHHDRKTAKEAGAGRAKKRREIRARFRRAEETHPGYALMARQGR